MDYLTYNFLVSESYKRYKAILFTEFDKAKKEVINGNTFQIDLTSFSNDIINRFNIKTSTTHRKNVIPQEIIDVFLLLLSAYNENTGVRLKYRWNNMYSVSII